MVYYIDRKGVAPPPYKKGGSQMDEPGKYEALQELLRVLADDPDVAERIVITIKPSKLKQGEAKGK